MIEAVAVGKRFSLGVATKCQTKVADLVFCRTVNACLGQPVFGTNTSHHICVLKNLAEGSEMMHASEFKANLGPGTCAVAVDLHAHGAHTSNSYEWCDHALVFNVININYQNLLA